MAQLHGAEPTSDVSTRNRPHPLTPGRGRVFEGLDLGRSVPGNPERSANYPRSSEAAMAKLIYVTNTSLDGYIEDRKGGFDWGVPDEEYFGFINDVERSVGTYLYGRRMYQSMVYWESAPLTDQPPWVVDFANMWRTADKVVFSKTLPSASSNRTSLEREFDVEAIRR